MLGRYDNHPRFFSSDFFRLSDPSRLDWGNRFGPQEKWWYFFIQDSSETTLFEGSWVYDGGKKQMDNFGCNMLQRFFFLNNFCSPFFPPFFLSKKNPSCFTIFPTSTIFIPKKITMVSPFSNIDSTKIPVFQPFFHLFYIFFGVLERWSPGSKGRSLSGAGSTSYPSCHLWHGWGGSADAAVIILPDVFLNGKLKGAPTSFLFLGRWFRDY